MAYVCTGVPNGLCVHKCAKWLMCTQVCKISDVCTSTKMADVCTSMIMAYVYTSVPSGLCVHKCAKWLMCAQVRKRLMCAQV